MVSSTGILSKGYPRENPWEVGETSDHKSSWGRGISGTCFACTLGAVFYGTCLHEGAEVSLRPLQATWTDKIDAEAAVLGSSFAKLLKTYELMINTQCLYLEILGQKVYKTFKLFTCAAKVPIRKVVPIYVCVQNS